MECTLKKSLNLYLAGRNKGRANAIEVLLPVLTRKEPAHSALVRLVVSASY